MNLQESINNFEAILESDRYAREQVKKVQAAIKSNNNYKKMGFDRSPKVDEVSNIKVRDSDGYSDDASRFLDGRLRKGSVVDSKGYKNSDNEYTFRKAKGNVREMKVSDPHASVNIHNRINARTKADEAKNPQHKSTQHEAVEELGRFVADIAKLYECGKCAENDELIGEILFEASIILENN